MFVLGDSMVGKTSLVNMFMRKDTYFCESTSDYVPTLIDSYKRLTRVDQEDIMVEIGDIGGSLDFTLIEKELAKADGIVLIFAVDDMNSFRTLSLLIRKISLISPDNPVPMLLVGNKCDLPTRKISTVDGRTMAGNCSLPYIETSARLGIQVDDVFHNIIRLIRSHKEQKIRKRPKEPSCCIMC